MNCHHYTLFLFLFAAPIATLSATNTTKNATQAVKKAPAPPAAKMEKPQEPADSNISRPAAEVSFEGTITNVKFAMGKFDPVKGEVTPPGTYYGLIGLREHPSKSFQASLAELIRFGVVEVKPPMPIYDAQGSYGKSVRITCKSLTNEAAICEIQQLQFQATTTATQSSATTAPQVPPPPQLTGSHVCSESGQVATRTTNARHKSAMMSARELSSSILANVSPTDSLWIMQETEEWLCVRNNSGIEGWVLRIWVF